MINLIKASAIVLAITCQPPVSSEAPHIMTDKETYNYNEIIQFSCSEGFFLQANQERNCTKNGPLKPPYPNCKGTDISWLMFTQGLLLVILHLCTTWIWALIGNGKTINISIQLVFLNLNACFLSSSYTLSWK